MLTSDQFLKDGFMTNPLTLTREPLSQHLSIERKPDNLIPNPQNVALINAVQRCDRRAVESLFKEGVTAPTASTINNARDYAALHKLGSVEDLNALSDEEINQARRFKILYELLKQKTPPPQSSLHDAAQESLQLVPNPLDSRQREYTNLSSAKSLEDFDSLRYQVPHSCLERSFQIKRSQSV